MSDLREEAIDYIVAKYKLPRQQVINIVRSQFLFMRERCKDLKETLIPYFGTVCLTPKGKRVLNGEVITKESNEDKGDKDNESDT